MAMISEKIQTADWKSEKHVPVIECSESVQADEIFQVQVSLGKEVAHPNTTGHHIRWIMLYFQPTSAKFPYEVAKVDFSAHGESAQGADQGAVYTHHCGCACMKTSEGGTLYAMAYCNIHGLWQSTKELTVT